MSKAARRYDAAVGSFAHYANAAIRMQYISARLVAERKRKLGEVYKEKILRPRNVLAYLRKPTDFDSGHKLLAQLAEFTSPEYVQAIQLRMRGVCLTDALAAVGVSKRDYKKARRHLKKAINENVQDKRDLLFGAR